MTTKTYTIHGLPDLPEGYGPELEYGIPWRDSVVLNTLPGNRSRRSRPATFGYGLYAPKTKPWYPAEWYDTDGQLLPDVYEHTPGEWPKHCKPGDFIDYMNQTERTDRVMFTTTYEAAGSVPWEIIAAYHIIDRA